MAKESNAQLLPDSARDDREAAPRRRVVRLDRPLEPEGSPDSVPKTKTEHNRLLDRLLRAFRTENDDRRGSRRHVAVRPETWIGWWSKGEFGTVEGKLLNISRGGALVIAGTMPPRRAPVYLYKDIGKAVACIRAEVVGVNPSPMGTYAVRLRFAAPCPTTICEASICDASPKKAHSGV